jgi:hypothetical protein
MATSSSSEPAVPQQGDHVAMLLAKALESLSPEERQQVTAWILARTTATTATQLGALGRRQNDELLQSLAPGSESFRDLYERRFGTTSVFGRGQQVVPVRLPTELHARLRLWCTEHGFSMATVVRGLVARFLDGQAPADAPEPPAEP